MEHLELIIEHLIDQSVVSIISSVDSDGYPNTKAMSKVRYREGIQTIYFSTNTSSRRVHHFRHNNKACLYFFDEKNFLGVMLKGHIDVLMDEKSRELLWRDGDIMFYPQGISDPDYCVLKFNVISGRLYNGSGSEDFILA